MTNREMLEFAAKADGYSITKGSSGYREFMCKGGVEWNPLEDDGDALRLAVRLGILLRTDFIKQLAELMCQGMDHGKTTRLAIVRTAVEIGRKM